jgi:hypothetical protein
MDPWCLRPESNRLLKGFNRALVPCQLRKQVLLSGVDATKDKTNDDQEKAEQDGTVDQLDYTSDNEDDSKN